MSWRIAWAGPWNARASIATFGAEIVAALTARGHRVDVLRTETGEHRDAPPLPAPAGLRHIGEIAPDRLRLEYDAVIANLGDHFGFHGALAPVLPAVDAVLILHDAFMANFCSGWAHQFPDPQRALRAMVTAAYGPDALVAGAPFWLPEAEMMRRRPMIELFAARAAAAVVHAGHYRALVARACPGPVAQIPLIVRGLAVPPVRPRARADAARQDTLRVATVGNINANKRVGEVIKAIGGSPALRARCSYRVIGAIEPARRQALEAEMGRHGVDDVEFTGWVDDARLRDLLADTDVICCLRHPVLEGGSGSLVEAMLSGRPVIVSDQGAYGELPDGVALKCRPGDEAADVARHLLALLRDPALLAAQGERGRRYALTTHTVAHYAEALLALTERASLGAPGLRPAAQFGSLLAAMGLGQDDPAVSRIAGTLRDLLGSPTPS